jgi:hypothetical protein
MFGDDPRDADDDSTFCHIRKCSCTQEDVRERVREKQFLHSVCTCRGRISKGDDADCVDEDIKSTVFIHHTVDQVLRVVWKSQVYDDVARHIDIGA